MATTKRALRRARGERGLSDRQRQNLLFGVPFCGAGSGFVDDVARRAAWCQHRAELMAAHEPGQRPAAYFQFDLREDLGGGRWWQQVAVLLRRGLIDPMEATNCERIYPLLDAVQPAGGNVFDEPGELAKQTLPVDVLCGLVEQFELAAAWHGWRGRPEIAAQYQRRAEVVRAALTELRGAQNA